MEEEILYIYLAIVTSENSSFKVDFPPVIALRQGHSLLLIAKLQLSQSNDTRGLLSYYFHTPVIQ